MCVGGTADVFDNNGNNRNDNDVLQRYYRQQLQMRARSKGAERTAASTAERPITLRKEREWLADSVQK